MTNPTGGYLDAVSGEPLHPAAREAFLAALDRGYADPLRLHGAAREARLLLDRARETVAGELGVLPPEVTFTASGTAAVHQGLLGLLSGRRRVSTRLVHSAVEHSSVLDAGTWWTRHSGGTADGVGVDRLGRVDVDALDEALDTPTGVVAVQAANPEVGTLQPLDEVAERCARHDVPLFSDVAAAAGRTAVPQGWAVAAASAHKWGGPAGVGVLLVRSGARWRAPFPTDDRVDPRTAGFENVPAVLAAAAALEAVAAERDEVAARQRRLVDRIRASVAAIEDVEVVGDPDRRLPHVVTFSCLYVDGETLVTGLDRHGFAVASGSACTASALEPSHVLAAMGALTHGNVRVSLTRDTTDDEVDRFLALLPRVVAEVRERLR
ncbi:MAG: aminotransferase class V-fold PLP-dependent enzyme [Nocardioidaceae bacterium]|nr:aminotransferase class V-fold PLP-dependent enzyme [Nocardioidaceae bacterium]